MGNGRLEMNERTNVTPRASHASRVRKLRPLTGHQRRRHPEKATYLTADNQMTRKPNLALNAEIESSGRAANSARCARAFLSLCPNRDRGSGDVSRNDGPDVG